jgi:hypothetical protein
VDFVCCVQHLFLIYQNKFPCFSKRHLFFEYRYSPLTPADFFAAATASYLPAAAAAAASATTLSPSTGN